MALWVQTVKATDRQLSVVNILMASDLTFGPCFELRWGQPTKKVLYFLFLILILVTQLSEMPGELELFLRYIFDFNPLHYLQESLLLGKRGGVQVLMGRIKLKMRHGVKR